MKTLLCSLTFAFCLCGSSVMAQFLTERSRVNPVGEAQVRALASRLAVGMPESDALRLLSTNGVNVNATVHQTNRWLRVFSYTNAPPGHACFWLEFRQKPTKHGPMKKDGLVVITNGILKGAFLHDVQIAHAKKP